MYKFVKYIVKCKFEKIPEDGIRNSSRNIRKFPWRWKHKL